MMDTPREAQVSCRTGMLLDEWCPRRLPRTPSYTSRWVVRSAVRESIEFHNGAASPFYPERDRPPRVAHVVVEAATGNRQQRLVPFTVEPIPSEARDGLMRARRTRGLFLGRVSWSGRDGRLILAPPYPAGGLHGDHLMFVSRQSDATCVVSLHGWEPFRESVDTLRAILEALPPQSR